MPTSTLPSFMIRQYGFLFGSFFLSRSFRHSVEHVMNLGLSLTNSFPQFMHFLVYHCVVFLSIFVFLLY